MLIDHVAIWVRDIERVKSFYQKYFNCSSGAKYRNESKNFESYFLYFENGARLELMSRPDIPDNINSWIEQYYGIIHIAIKTGSREGVDGLAESLRGDGYAVIEEPRVTGDGYYECCILDPENNRIEIVA